jgi:hypothetical protein
MNGSAVALALDLPSALVPAKVITPTEVEQRIGEIVAMATIVTFVGMEEVADGGLAPATRARAGDLLVALYRLQEDTLGQIDFDVIARREGKRILWARYGTTMREHLRYANGELDAALDTLIDRPLEILHRVTAIERALAH